MKIIGENIHIISKRNKEAIEARNKEYINSNDISLWAKCKFITVINK